MIVMIMFADPIEVKTPKDPEPVELIRICNIPEYFCLLISSAGWQRSCCRRHSAQTVGAASLSGSEIYITDLMLYNATVYYLSVNILFAHRGSGSGYEQISFGESTKNCCSTIF